MRVSGAAGNSIDRRACTDAAEVPGVLISGAVGRTREVGALGLDAGLALTEVSPEVIEMVWPEATPDSGDAALLTPGFVALTRVNQGTLNVKVGGSATAVETVALHGPTRYAVLDGGVVVARNDLASVEYCLVAVPGEKAEAVALDIASATVSYGTLAVPVVSRKDATPTPADLIRDHRSRYGSLLAGASLGVLGALRIARFRRDRAIYRLLGFGRADLWVMGLTDYVICIATPVSSTFASALLWGVARGVPTETIGAEDMALLAWASTVIGLVYASAWAAGRNRHQFAPGV